MPDKIAQMYPDLWVDEDEEEGKNLNEGPLIQTQLDRYRRKIHSVTIKSMIRLRPINLSASSNSWKNMT